MFQLLEMTSLLCNQGMSYEVSMSSLVVLSLAPPRLPVATSPPHLPSSYQADPPQSHCLGGCDWGRGLLAAGVPVTSQRESAGWPFLINL